MFKEKVSTIPAISVSRNNTKCDISLTKWGRGKMAAFSQTMFSNALSGMEMCAFRLRFYEIYPINNIPTLLQIMVCRLAINGKFTDAYMRHSASVSNLNWAWISNHMPSKVWDQITYPFLNFNSCTPFHPTLYNGCNYLYMLILTVNHVCKRGPRTSLWLLNISTIHV